MGNGKKCNNLEVWNEPSIIDQMVGALSFF